MRQSRTAALALLLGCADLVEGGADASTTDAGTTALDGTGSATGATPPIFDIPPPATLCETPDDITNIGVAGASSVFSGYPPILAVDGDVTTSWFSIGDRLDPDPVVFSWQVGLGATEAEITEIHLTGNGDHENPAFREDFGFAAVTIVLLGDNEEVLLEEEHTLPGTPDPALSVAVADVLSHRVELHFTDREDPDAGGFAELSICGTAH